MSTVMQLVISCSAALILGVYNGFYGPGTGTLFLLSFCKAAKFDVRTANGNTKVVTSLSNISSFATSLMSGKVFLALGLIGAVASMTGNFFGSGLAIHNGSKAVRPAVLVVLALMTVKVLSGMIG